MAAGDVVACGEVAGEAVVAGVSCALECVDIQLDTVAFEAEPEPCGQLVEIPHSIRNVATGLFADGAALCRGLQDAARTLGHEPVHFTVGRENC